MRSGSVWRNRNIDRAHHATSADFLYDEFFRQATAESLPELPTGTHFSMSSAGGGGGQRRSHYTSTGGSPLMGSQQDLQGTGQGVTSDGDIISSLGYTTRNTSGRSSLEPRARLTPAMVAAIAAELHAAAVMRGAPPVPGTPAGAPPLELSQAELEAAVRTQLAMMYPGVYAATAAAAAAAPAPALAPAAAAGGSQMTGRPMDAPGGGSGVGGGSSGQLPPGVTPVRRNSILRPPSTTDGATGSTTPRRGGSTDSRRPTSSDSRRPGSLDRSIPSGSEPLSYPSAQETPPPTGNLSPVQERVVPGSSSGGGVNVSSVGGVGAGVGAGPGTGGMLSDAAMAAAVAAAMAAAATATTAAGTSSSGSRTSTGSRQSGQNSTAAVVAQAVLASLRQRNIQDAASARQQPGGSSREGGGAGVAAAAVAAGEKLAPLQGGGADSGAGASADAAPSLSASDRQSIMYQRRLHMAYESPRQRIWEMFIIAVGSIVLLLNIGIIAYVLLLLHFSSSVRSTEPTGARDDGTL